MSTSDWTVRPGWRNPAGATPSKARAVSGNAIAALHIGLHDTPDIIAAQKKAGYDLEILRNQFATAQVRENVLTTWYAEWDRFMQQQIQNVLLRQIKPAEAMAASAKKARELKKSA